MARVVLDVAVRSLWGRPQRNTGDPQGEDVPAASVALNLIRLGTWWNGHPLDRTRVSHPARLGLSLAA
ncbi:hypothetical protein [Streptomyces sp. NBC_00582]|uniref:hypothetical protein n=1 Tax=Streptomyces sp. NBC_00582 TaxID=2975783 RepID=UPI002E81F553|nr:hypothetical protein [Streptomyces sp. NBC_00582]WUB59082.1 hypothetical protein OG852_00790 [Streptomyces sp. NBC_00582]WUB67646.1 hypothetical protein OG852_48345 [Streptomyces sp. NBC_00582]